MNYGILNFKAQNGKPGIFWTDDRNQKKQKPNSRALVNPKASDKAQKITKDFNYKGRDQNFKIRNHPRNYDRLSPERDNVLKPITQNGAEENPPEEKPKKPQKNFIQRNRIKAGSKATKTKPGAKEEDVQNKTVTLTQQQLNAILSSVGKVASGDEEKLKISIDEKNSITIESPRRGNDDDGHDRHDSSERKPNKSRHSKKEEESIYAFLGKDTNRSRKGRNDDDIKTREKKKIEREDTDDLLLRKLKERFGNDFEKEKSSREKDNRDRYSPDRESPVDRSRKSKRDKERSRERYRSDHDRDRYHDDDRGSRDRHRDSERGSRDRHRDDDKRSRDRHRDNDRGSRDRYRDNDRGSRDRYRDNDRGSRDRHRDYERDKQRDSRDRQRKDSNENDNSVSQTGTTKPDDLNTPRDVVGIPLALSWKHMTVAERRRLTMARDKARLEEEKKEEEAVRNKWQELKRRDDNGETHDRRGKSRHREPSRERTPERSRERDYSRDRYEKSRERRDGSREHQDRSRDRRERSRDRYQRSRTPSPVERGDDRPSNKSNSVSDKSYPSLSYAEKKRLQWQKERAESAANEVGYQPWGRPGAGAPLRTPSGKVAADYRSRQDDGHSPIEEEQDENQPRRDAKEEPRRRSDQSRKRKYDVESKPTNESRPLLQSQSSVPAAMRSSFVFGGLAADAEMQMNIKEEERKQWVKELDKQREEKRKAQMKDLDTGRDPGGTWADKFSQDHKPVGLPEQPKELLNKDDRGAIETGRISSAPVASKNAEEEDKSYIRGQNVFIDPVTKKELEDKRQRQIEHQKAIMEQVQERQRIRQQEKERKMREDLEEENKLKSERERLQKQLEYEQNKVKMKEMKRQEEVERLKQTMDDAHERAMREKYSRKMQHLEQGGHDTSQLKAHLADQPSSHRYFGIETTRTNAGHIAKLTPREDSKYVAPSYVPGLNLEVSPRGVPMVTTGQMTQKDLIQEPYTENRILTPSQFRKNLGLSPKREFGTQTGMKHADNVNTQLVDEPGMEYQNIQTANEREVTDVGIMYKIVNGKRVRVKSAPKEERQSYTNRSNGEQAFKKKKPEKIKGKKKWNFQNKDMKKPVKQSEKDPFFEKKQLESRERRERRKEELLRLVDVNRDRIPTERPNRTPGSSRDPSPMSEGGRTPRSVQRQQPTRRSKSYSPELRTDTRVLDKSLSPVNRSLSPPASHRSITPQILSNRRKSPPIPALRHRHYNEGGADVLRVEHNSLVPVNVPSHTKYGDTDPLEIPVGSNDFVPFTRTVDVLDPALSNQPLPMSREATQVENARKAYIKGMKPGNYGNRVDMYQDRMRMPNEPKTKDPIMNPSLVKDHPTHRQDMILQQLSSLKENLIQRQRELETFSPTDLE